MVLACFGAVALLAVLPAHPQVAIYQLIGIGLPLSSNFVSVPVFVGWSLMSVPGANFRKKMFDDNQLEIDELQRDWKEERL